MCKGLIGNDNVTVKYEALLRQSPDPEAATVRLERLLEDALIRKHINGMTEATVSHLIHLLSISNFLYHFFCRNPDSIYLLGDGINMDISEPDRVSTIAELRLFKYQELLKITWLDLMGEIPYQVILNRLSVLADKVIYKALELVSRDKKYPGHVSHPTPFCIIAMGKLGAVELNYSSDVDLIFVSADENDITGDIHAFQEFMAGHIRKFTHTMERATEDGFLYRVDLKLRPWGRSGPLVLSVDETEHYYEASTEAWERFAWLRARVVAGNTSLGNDLLERLQPFIFHRTLSSDDLERFIMIKNKMATQRHKAGSWNVKFGEGGIRDIEFFIQILQIVNAHNFPGLKTTNTLSTLHELVKAGLLEKNDGHNIHNCYLFLRRLENRLQMMDEKQTHKLPVGQKPREKIARSLNFNIKNDNQSAEVFENQLNLHREIAKSCFERILPRES